MTSQREPTELEKAIGWTFRDVRLLTTAMTHSTYANEHPEDGSDYERLEFLGDAVLGLVAARLLCDRHMAATEGELSRRRARVVRRETLAVLGEKLHVDGSLRLGAGQRKAGGVASRRILADAYEALAGAVYMDGGYEAAERCFAGHIATAIDLEGEPVDFKTQLQEACHRLHKPQPRYVIAAISGPDHARHFSCEVHIGADVGGRGDGSSKKIAEQQCAREALTYLQELENNPLALATSLTSAPDALADNAENSDHRSS